MSTTNVKIMSAALNKIGERGILTTADKSHRAEVVTRDYDIIRRSLLRKYLFNFSLVRTQLAATASAPSFGYDFQYLKPNDFLRPASIQDGQEIKIEGDYILSDVGNTLNIVYVADVQDPTKFDPIFVELLILHLAYHIVEPLTQSNTKKAALADDIRELKRRALLVDAAEDSSEELEDTGWITGRV